MNRKNKIHVTASFMIKSALVLAILGMLVVTAHSAPFLDGDGNPDSYDHYTIENYPKIELLDGTEVMVVDRTGTSNIVDTWAEVPGGYYDDTDNEGTVDNNVTNDIYTGFYVGTFSGNDGVGNGNKIDIRELIKYFLDIENDTEIAFLGYDKDEDNDDSFGNLSVTINTTDGGYTGTWDVTNTENTNNSETINFYTVKGSDEFALYYVDPAQSSGKWTTAHLLTKNENNIPDISHFAVIKSLTNTPGDGNPDPIPEPATMLLFGFSLMGLAGMARRKNSKF